MFMRRVRCAGAGVVNTGRSVVGGFGFAGGGGSFAVALAGRVVRGFYCGSVSSGGRASRRRRRAGAAGIETCSCADMDVCLGEGMRLVCFLFHCVYIYMHLCVRICAYMYVIVRIVFVCQQMNSASERACADAYIEVHKSARWRAHAVPGRLRAGPLAICLPFPANPPARPSTAHSGINGSATLH